MRAFWFRRDRRLGDNLALSSCALAAIADGGKKVVPIFWYDKNSFDSLSGIRQHSLTESLKCLDSSIDNSLNVLEGPSVKKIAEYAKERSLTHVHATESFDPEGIKEQIQLEQALSVVDIKLILEDSYYAVKPGSVIKSSDGLPYKVYTPFYKIWREIGWQKPHKLPTGFDWVKDPKMAKLPVPSKNAPFPVKAGEAYALETLQRFKERALFDYSDNRNRADLSGTSKLSHALAHGEIHPRTLLEGLTEVEGHVVFRKEIAWREFYADVLYRNLHTLDDYFEPRFKNMRYDSGKSALNKLERWKNGTTGFPMVDAGMRQLLAEGWMHNRVRMIVASFLVKDLHLEWQQGAKWFEENLSDYDPASNSHGWQWTAGCGTDASPYYRVFNPILQGYKFDPNGEYVRKYIPELSHLKGAEVHEPWLLIDGLAHGYPEPMLDHSKERDEALARLEEIKIK